MLRLCFVSNMYNNDKYEQLVFHIQWNLYISNSVFTNTWCISTWSKCYQGPKLAPFTSMLNKLGYIKLYISKTWLYQSFSEVPCHLDQFKKFKITLIFSVSWSNTSKLIETSQFFTDIYHSYIKHIESNQHCFYWTPVPSFLL